MASLLEEMRGQANGHLDKLFSTLDEHTELLSQLIRDTQAREVRDVWVNKVVSGQADPAGLIQQEIASPRPGYFWVWQNFTVEVSAGSAYTFSFYLDQVARPNAIFWPPTSDNINPMGTNVLGYSQGALEIFISERRKLIYSGKGGANAFHAVTCQFKEYEIPPEYPALDG